MPKIGKQDRDFIYNRDGNKCLCCGSKENLTIDHVIPTVRGGENNRKNYQTLCKPCNMKKASRIRDFRELAMSGKIKIPDEVKLPIYAKECASPFGIPANKKNFHY
jgi:5-methylcytosine-specific restriction endonuclease McrA